MLPAIRLKDVRVTFIKAKPKLGVERPNRTIEGGPFVYTCLRLNSCYFEASPLEIITEVFSTACKKMGHLTANTLNADITPNDSAQPFSR